MDILKGKTALVTGASSGIGKAIALLFAQESAKVIMTYHSGKDRAQAVIEEIMQRGGNIALLLSQVKLGLSVAYPVSQAAVIVSVFGGVFINHEHKTRKEWIFAGTGILIICAGLSLIYLSSR